MSPAPRGLTRSRFSLEDTDLPEITISNGFYTGPGRFFVGTPQSQPSASPNALREPPSGTDSDVVLLPTPTVRHVHHAPPEEATLPDLPIASRVVSPPVPPSVVSVPGTERSIRSVVALWALETLLLAIPVPLARDPSLALRHSAMECGWLRNAIPKLMSRATALILDGVTSDTTSPLSAGPQARLPLPNQNQVVVHSRREPPPTFCVASNPCPRRSVCKCLDSPPRI
jgi:hypothetical protein